MKTIFNASQGDKITFDQIKDFCALKIPENERLDYKRDLKKDVLKHIAAMINTDGGIILVGVPDEKDENGKRSLPGTPIGIPIEQKPTEKILNWCYTTFQPYFCPDIWEIETNDEKSVVVLIKISKDAAVSLPIYHTDDQSIYIRIGDQTRRADPFHIKKLLLEYESREQILLNNFAEWTTYKLRSTKGFYWVSLGLLLPNKAYSSQNSFNSSMILQLRNIIANHRLGKKVWVQRYSPYFDEDDDQYNSFIRNYSPLDLSVVDFVRRENFVKYYPSPLGSKSLHREPDPKYGTYYEISFDANNYFLGTVGFPKETKNDIVTNMHGAIYSFIDLLCQDEIRQCFSHIDWDYGTFKLFAQLSEFPGEFQIPQFIDSYNQPLFPTESSLWSGPHELEVFRCLEPEKIATHFLERFLAWVGFVIREESIELLHSLITKSEI